MLFYDTCLKVGKTNLGKFDEVRVNHIPLGLRRNIFITDYIYVNKNDNPIYTSGYDYDEDKNIITINPRINDLKEIIEKLQDIKD